MDAHHRQEASDLDRVQRAARRSEKPLREAREEAPLEHVVARSEVDPLSALEQGAGAAVELRDKDRRVALRPVRHGDQQAAVEVEALRPMRLDAEREPRVGLHPEPDGVPERVLREGLRGHARDATGPAALGRRPRRNYCEICSTTSPVWRSSAMPRDVGLGDDAHRLAVLLDHRQPPHLVLRHQAKRLVERLLRVDGDEIARGDVADGRRHVLPLGDRSIAMSRSVTIPTRTPPSAIGRPRRPARA